MSQVEFKDNPYIAVVAKKHRNLKKKHEKILKIESQVLTGKVLDEEQLILYNSRVTIVKSMNDLKSLLTQLEDIAKEEQQVLPQNTNQHQEPTEESKSSIVEEVDTHAPIFPSNAPVNHPDPEIVKKYDEADVLKLLKVFHVISRYETITNKNIPEFVDFFGKTLSGQTSIKGFQDTLNASLKTCMSYLDEEESSKREVVRGVTLSQISSLIDELSLDMADTISSVPRSQHSHSESEVCNSTIENENEVINSIVESEVIKNNKSKRSRKNTKNSKLTESKTPIVEQSSSLISNSSNTVDVVSTTIAPVEVNAYHISTNQPGIKDSQDEIFEKLLIPRNRIAAAAAKASSKLDINFFPVTTVSEESFVRSSFLNSLHSSDNIVSVNNLNDLLHTSRPNDVSQAIETPSIVRTDDSVNRKSKRNRRNKLSNEHMKDSEKVEEIKEPLVAVPQNSTQSNIIPIPALTPAPPALLVPVVSNSALVNPTPIPPIMGVEAALRYLTQPPQSQPTVALATPLSSQSQTISVAPIITTTETTNNNTLEASDEVTNPIDNNIKGKRTRRPKKHNQTVSPTTIDTSVSIKPLNSSSNIEAVTKVVSIKKDVEALSDVSTNKLKHNDLEKKKTYTNRRNNGRSNDNSTTSSSSKQISTSVVVTPNPTTSNTVPATVSFTAAVANKTMSPVIVAAVVSDNNHNNIKKTHSLISPSMQSSSSSQGQIHPKNHVATNTNSKITHVVTHKNNLATDGVHRKTNPNYSNTGNNNNSNSNNNSSNNQTFRRPPQPSSTVRKPATTNNTTN